MRNPKSARTRRLAVGNRKERQTTFTQDLNRILTGGAYHDLVLREGNIFSKVKTQKFVPKIFFTGLADPISGGVE
jgi:hypothetical protein